MIPIKLIIEGIYSYQERQEIDFEELTAAGLFGIFGAVGSGKSSILEAISFVLYGETERLNARDKRNYNMMNLQSDRSFIEFEFLNHEERKFKAVREYRRNSKNFDDVRPQNVAFYEFKANQWMPLEHTNAEEILGLSYQNFKRTIIIPQGQFKEFLELGARDRTTMMKEIFDLHRFDLQDKTSSLLKKNRSELDVLEGKLSGFEEVHEEMLKDLEKRLKEEKEKLSKLKESHGKTDEAFRKLKELRDEFNLLQANLKKQEKFKAQKEEIKQKELQLEKFEKTQKQFAHLIKEEAENKSQFTIKNNELEKKDKEFNDLKKLLGKLNDKFSALKPEYEKLEERKQKAVDLEIICKLIGLETKIVDSEKRTKKGKGFVLEEEEKKKKTETKLKSINDHISQLKSQKTDSKILIEISGWYEKSNNLKEESRERKIKIDELKKNIDGFDKEINDLKINPESFEDDFEKRFKKIESDKQKLSEHRSHLILEQKLTEYSHALHDGEPCPLCGSSNHPKVLEGKDVSEELKKVENAIKDSEKETIELNRLKIRVNKILNSRKIYQDQLTAESESLKKTKEQKNKLLEGFVWKKFDPQKPKEFEVFKDQSYALEKQIQEKEKESQKTEEEVKNIQSKIEKAKDKLHRIELEEKESKTQFATQKSNLKTLKYEAFNNKDASIILKQAEDLKAKNLQIEKGFKSTEKEINENKIKESGLISTRKGLQNILDELNEKSKRIFSELKEKLETEKFSSKEEMLEVLNLDLNSSEIRKQIQNFEIEWEKLKSKIKEQKEKLKDFELNDEAFETEKKKFEELTQALQIHADKTSKTEGELTRVKKAFEAKKDLLKQQDKLQKREDNLKILFNLFKGQGFVNYISGIYLRQLCDHANLRFHRMTRNQLSLNLDENLNFEIIDYLNEGRSRSVKTLSGGQSFQVSLSLALALAESVQSHSKAEKNFFFIDEGFGTQDTEAVNVVFDTLMQLQKENRIVGIISHVSELKDRIPTSLHIFKDEKRGSLIERG